jgi:hypothetical protein
LCYVQFLNDDFYLNGEIVYEIQVLFQAVALSKLSIAQRTYQLWNIIHMYIWCTWCINILLKNYIFIIYLLITIPWCVLIDQMQNHEFLGIFTMVTQLTFHLQHNVGFFFHFLVLILVFLTYKLYII